ncbi:MAG: SRPBCC domain-containing protein [Pseudomonadota bacterium]
MAQLLAAQDETADLFTVRLNRQIAASPERIFDAWTDADALAKWWGPKGFTNKSAAIDARPGGAFEITMVSPDGRETRMAGIVLELDRPRLIRLEIRHRQFEGAAEAPGGFIPTHVEIRPTEEAGGTRLDLTHSGFLEAAQPAGFTEGWQGSFDRLETLLAAA